MRVPEKRTPATESLTLGVRESHPQFEDEQDEHDEQLEQLELEQPPQAGRWSEQEPFVQLDVSCTGCGCGCGGSWACATTGAAALRARTPKTTSKRMKTPPCAAGPPD
jgi:hypothetical protein